MDYLKLLNTRYACRNYNGKLVSKSDVDYILNCANLTQTALNIQNHAFATITTKTEFKKLIDCTINQPYLENAGGFIIVFAKMEGLIGEDTKFISDLFASRVEPGRPLEYFVDNYKANFKDTDFKSYSLGQSNFAVSNIVNAATSLGIKSNVVASYDKDKLIKAFNIDVNNYYPNVIIPLGYSDEDIPPKKRLELAENIVFDL